jgi:hypothetical protein
VCGSQATVSWHSPHSLAVMKCPENLPVAVVPSWQDEHEPRTWLWSTLLAGLHAVVLWQPSQTLVEST